MATNIHQKSDKVAIYCRVSTQMQSTDRQREELIAYSKKHDYHVEDKHIYVDIISGYSLTEERPQYTAMLDEVDLGNIDTILFSELTRLGRNSTELLAEVQRLQDKGVNLYFEKQDMWVKPAKKDLGSRILLAVLAITTSYEIELFAERSISGKINRVNKGGGVGGDNNAYGYQNDENKIMVKRNDEALVVNRIFNMYAEGKSSFEICDILNSERIPTAYATRIQEFQLKRKQKGLPPKEYNFKNLDNFRWKPSAITKLLSNELYTGRRRITFHKPHVDRIDEGKGLVKEREVVHNFDMRFEELRIVSDELFQRVQVRLASAAYNKNNAMRHDNLVKHKMICGECGSNFSVSIKRDTTNNYKSGTRTYKCYGRVSRSDKPQTCTVGPEIRQWRLDGLVLTLSLQMFALINIKENNEKLILKLNNDIKSDEKIIDDKKQELASLENTYKDQLRRLSRIKGRDNIVNNLLDEEQLKYEAESSELLAQIKKKQDAITDNSITINRLERLAKQYVNLKDKMNEIWNSKELVKSMIDEYINKILVYRIHPLWNLIIVRYNNDTEFWGTIKNARYKYQEMFYDPLLCQHGIEFQAWIINNSSHCFHYDKVKHTVTYDGTCDIYSGIPKGTHTFDEFNKILLDAGWIGSYPLYDYENQSTSLTPEEPIPDFLKNRDSNTHIDWGNHNNRLLATMKNNKTQK